MPPDASAGGLCPQVNILGSIANDFQEAYGHNPGSHATIEGGDEGSIRIAAILAEEPIHVMVIGRDRLAEGPVRGHPGGLEPLSPALASLVADDAGRGRLLGACRWPGDQCPAH